ncbi:MAG: TetR family transcriptional regulator, partial [Actinobacteria bacterium]|nr:TetR family transcriptional regulator [Actinomycetota bacterium]
MPPRRRAPRSDVIENRARLLLAARDAFVERGPGVALEEIARRAGCGIATLYRRFPDRTALMRAVIVDALRQTIEQAQRAGAEEPDAFAALVRYMHAVLDLRTAAVISALLGAVSMTDDPELAQARQHGAEEVGRLIAAAHRVGTLRPDVTFADIGVFVVRLSQPLPATFSSFLPSSSPYYLAPALTQATNSLHLTSPQDLGLFSGNSPISLPVMGTAVSKFTTSSGNGSSDHLSAELFWQQTKTEGVHVPYKGGAPAVNDLLGNQVD